MTGPTPRRSIHAPTDTTWHEQARCRQEDPELFFHPEGERASTRDQRISDARAICERCPVLATCRAENMHEKHGIWGGLSEEERAAIRAGETTKATPGLMAVPVAVKLPTKGQGLDPGPVAAHVAQLIRAGFNPTSIGRFAGVTPYTVSALVQGKTQHVTHIAARKLLSTRVREVAACGDKVGTLTGRNRHRDAAQEPCTDCKAAFAAYYRERRAKRRAAA